MIAFEDVSISCYSLSYKPKKLDLKEGDIVIDLSLSGLPQTPRRRFTLAHELSHWILHRSYHSPTNQVFAFKRAGYLSCDESCYGIKEKARMTDSEKEEWQANSLAAAILMPKFAFQQQAYREIRRRYGASENRLHKSIDPIGYKETINSIAEIFNVSAQATEIRLEQFDIID